MTRVGSFTQSLLLQQSILSRQAENAKIQRQVSSGHKAPDIQGIADDASALFSAQSAVRRVEDYTKIGQNLKLRLDQNDAAVTGLRDSVEDLRQEVIGTLAKRDTSNLYNQVSQLFKLISSQLETKIDGKYIFGGTREDTTPLGFNSLATLLALPDAASGFSNSQIAPAVEVDANLQITSGLLADDLGVGVMDVIRNIARFHQVPLATAGGDILVNGALAAGATTLNFDGSLGTLTGDLVAGDTITFAGDTTNTIYTVTAPATAAGNAISVNISPPLTQAFADNTVISLGGPFGGPITPQQRQFLDTQLSLLSIAESGIDNQQAINGIRQAQLGRILDRHEATGNLLKGFSSDLQDVDLAEAISRLNQSQLALEASLKVTAEVGQLSLLNYI